MSVPPHHQPTHPLPAPQRPTNRLPLIIGGVVLGVMVLCGGVVFLVLLGRSIGDDAASRHPELARPQATATAPSSASASTPAVEETPEETIEVPEVVGKNAAVAQDELERAGFTRIEFGAETAGEYVVVPANWTVTKQSAAPGERLAPDTLIVLTCVEGA